MSGQTSSSPQTYFETRDLLQAAVLQCLGFPLLEIVPGGEDGATFVFPSSDKIVEAAQKFLSDQPILIRPRTLGKRVGRLRSRCRELKKTGHREGHYNVKSTYPTQ